MLTILPIRYVADVEVTRRFYAGLGLRIDPMASLEVFAYLHADAGGLGVHDAGASKGRPPGTVELGFTTDEKLEDLADRLTVDGYAPELVEENFGHSIRVTDPDGVVIQIQEIDIETARRTQDELRH